MKPFEASWGLIESQDHLEQLPFYDDLLKHLKYQFRSNGTWIEKKISTRKRERSEEARSRESKPQSQEVNITAPATRKTKSKTIQPAAKRQKREDPGEQTISEQHDPPQITDAQQENVLFNPGVPSAYTFYEQVIIQRELRIDWLWAELRAGRRKEKELLKEYNELKKQSRSHHTSPLTDSE